MAAPAAVPLPAPLPRSPKARLLVPATNLATQSEPLERALQPPPRRNTDKTIIRNLSTPVPPPPPLSDELAEGDICVCKFDFSQDEENKLALCKGDEIVFNASHPGGWGFGELTRTGASGYFPLQYVVKQATKGKDPAVATPFIAPLPPPLTSPIPVPRKSPAGKTLSPSNSFCMGAKNRNRAPSPPRTRATSIEGKPMAMIRSSQSFAGHLNEAARTPGSPSRKIKPPRRPQSIMMSPPSNDRLSGDFGGIMATTPPHPQVPGLRLRRASTTSAQHPCGEFDSDSIVNNKNKTRHVLDTWLKTKRPDMDELQKRGILSTDGKIDGIQFAKKNVLGSKKELIGMSLDELLEAVPGRDIPFLVDQCVTFIRRNAMTLHGVFRVSPNQLELQKLKALYKTPYEVIDLEKKV